MVSFERFARPAILKMAGHSELERPALTVTVRERIQSDGRESYLRAIVSRDPVKPDAGGYSAITTGGQGSHMMTSLVRANALLIIPEGVTVVENGAPLTAILLDRL
jgi:molybdopterin molybdotransferase